MADAPAAPMGRAVLGMRVDATSYEAATASILRWARDATSHYVCIATVHMTMEAYDSSDYRAVVNQADLVTADGMPLVWALDWLGVPEPTRVCGPELMPFVLGAAAQQGVPIGLYGGSDPRFLDRLVDVIRESFPGIQVVFAHSPPFRGLSTAEDLDVVKAIRDSGARILFVGLGCPKQERWMAQHQDALACTMLGVGAAFDFLAGIKPLAPEWMKKSGLEWLYRLACEPKRLWRRYLKQNPRFIALLIMQLLRLRRYV